MKIAVIFWSGTGNTQIMAHSVADGVKMAGADVDIFEVCDFDINKMGDYDALAFGCPASGGEQLEDSEFEPMFYDAVPHLGDKKVGIFGSYGWGDTEWMQTWEGICRQRGLNLVSKGVIAHLEPDDEAVEECEELGKLLAK